MSHPLSPHHLFPTPVALVPGPGQSSGGTRRVRTHRIRRLRVVLTATTVVLAAVPSAALAAPAPPVSTGHLLRLASLGGQGSFGAKMNERGDMIGASVDAADKYQAVVWWQGRRSPTALGITDASPVAINEIGHIIGYAARGVFLWRDGIGG